MWSVVVAVDPATVREDPTMPRPSDNTPPLAPLSSLAVGCVSMFLVMCGVNGIAFAQATPPSAPKATPKQPARPSPSTPATKPADGEKPSSEEPAPESTPGQRDPSDPITPEEPTPDALPDGRDPGPPIHRGRDNAPQGAPMKRSPNERQIAPPKPPDMRSTPNRRQPGDPIKAPKPPGFGQQ